MIPELRNILDASPVAGKFTNLADFFSGLYGIAFSIATFLAFFWIVWGAFEWLTAGANKQQIERARSRIIWAIVGLLIIALAFLVAQFAGQILKPKTTIPI